MTLILVSIPLGIILVGYALHRRALKRRKTERIRGL